MLKLTVLSIPDCPNEPLMTERLNRVLADHPGARLVHHVVHDEGDAARLGMHGSPTVLIDGADPFADPGTPASVSCRIYHDETGRAEGAPSLGALRAALGQAAERAARPALPDAVDRAGRGRLAPTKGGLRAVHQRVLRVFAETGHAPSIEELTGAAAPYGSDGRTVLARLHAADFLRLDADGAISAAYPFSAVPTAHVVDIDDGPTVYAMCAIDALGIAAMLGKPVTIHSTEPGTGTPITVTVPAGNGRAVWNPATAVVFAGQQTTSAEPDAAAQVCCLHINFFATADDATAWAGTHPQITGRTLSQEEAVTTGVQIFGPLLRTGR